MSAPRDDAAIEELLGAFALDALEPDEVADVEALLERRPDLAREADRLVRTAAWLGATEAIAARPEMRDELFARARAERAPTSGAPDDAPTSDEAPPDAPTSDEAPPAAPTSGDGPVQTYRGSTERLAETFGSFDTAASDTPTPNGLTARDLVVHLAAQESLLAQVIDRTVVPDIRDDDIDTRTASFVARYREASLDEVTDVWRRSVDEVVAWAADPATRRTSVPWIGLDMPRDNFLVARAFENWIHRDDLRRAQGHASEAPAPAELHEMATLSMQTLPFALLVTEHAHPGKVARVVLTGPGGGEWRLSMGGRTPADGTPPDVTFTTNVVDWCLVAGERLEPGELDYTVEGEVELAADLVAAAPAFSTL